MDTKYTIKITVEGLRNSSYYHYYDKKIAEKAFKAYQDKIGQKAYNGDTYVSVDFTEAKETRIAFTIPSGVHDPIVDSTGLFKLGSLFTDCRCTGREIWYCCLDNLAKGLEEFNAQSKAMADRINSYYSQPWV